MNYFKTQKQIERMERDLKEISDMLYELALREKTEPPPKTNFERYHIHK